MITEFISYIKNVKGYSDNTARAYNNDLRSFVKVVKIINPSSRWSTLTLQDIDEVVKYNVQRGLKPSTTNRQISAVKALYDYMKREGMIDYNPARYESRRKQADTIPNTIPMHDLEEAYAESTGTTRLMLGLLVYTGIRIQELLDIRKHDVNTKTGEIIIRGKGMKERKVITAPDNAQELEAYMRNLRPDSFIFGSTSQREARYELHAILKRHSQAKQLSPHAIRHTFATELAKQGSNVTTLAKMMGHNSIKTTQHYIDLTQNNIDKTYQQYHSIF